MDDRLPFMFIVEGIPKSAQSKSGSAKWRAKVAAAAEERWAGGLLALSHLSVVIVYYFKDSSLDVDNMVKPILDALKNVIYEDDSIVDQVVARKTGLISGFQIADATPDLIAAIDNDADFVYVRIGEGPDHGTLP